MNGTTARQQTAETPRETEPGRHRRPGLRDLFFGLGFAVLLVSSLTLASDYLAPIAVAVLIWFLINGLAGALSWRLPWLPDRVCTWVAVAMLFLGLFSVSQIVARNVGALTEGLSGVDDRLLAAAEDALASVGLGGRVDFDALISGMNVEDMLTEALGAARGVLSNLALVFLYVMFLMLDQRFYDAKLRALAPDEDQRDWLKRTLKRIADETRAYLWLMTLISAGVGVSTGLILWLFGVAGAAFWGFLAFGLNFIPTIGSILAVAVPCVYALLQFDDPTRLLGLIPALGLVQFVAGEVVLPRVMGHRLNLSSFVIILLLVTWGAMWGPAGMFLAIPITMILMIVFSQFPRTRPIAIALSKTGRLAEPLAPPPRLEGAPEL